jgi:hypothetical protein
MRRIEDEIEKNQFHKLFQIKKNNQKNETRFDRKKMKDDEIEKQILIS